MSEGPQLCNLLSKRLLQVKLEAERQTLISLKASQEDSARLAQHSEQLAQSVREQRASLHALQEQQSEHSAKRRVTTIT
jgi:hypothetical protein